MNEAERRIAALSPEQRELMMRRLKEKGAARPVAVAAPPELPRIPEGPADRGAPVPLTDVQEAFWIGRSGILDLGGCGANVYIEDEFPGVVQPFADSLNTALRRVIDRHEMLRTVVLSDGTQRLLPEVPPFEVTVEDLSGWRSELVEQHLEEVRERMRYAREPVDRWPLFEIVLHQLDEGLIRLHARFDALLMDGTARGVLLMELVPLLIDPQSELPPVDVSYLDYARALAAFRDTATYRRSRAYWMEHLGSLPPAPRLPVVREIGPETVPRIVKRQLRMLEPEPWSALKQHASRSGLSPSAALTAAFAEALRPWSSNASFTLGLGGSQRHPIHPQIRRVIGSFTTLHLLAAEDVPGPFEARAQALQRRLVADMDHAHFSGHQVLRELNRRRGAGARATLPVQFNSVVEYAHPTNQASEAGADSGETEEQAGNQQATLTLTEIDLMISLPQALLLCVAIEDSDGALEMVSQAVEEVFPEDLIPRFLDGYRGLLERLAVEDAAWREERPLPAGPPGTEACASDELPIEALGYGADLRRIESVLASHPGVREAVVAWLPGQPSAGHGRLVGWIVPRDGAGPRDEDLRRHARAALPAHRIPSAFVRIPSILDRSALPLPAEPPHRLSVSWSPLEAELADLWEEVLGQRPASSRDDFFALGGDSLLAVRLLGRISSRWGPSLPVADLFAQPTLEGMAEAVRSALVRPRVPVLERLAAYTRRAISRLRPDTEAGPDGARRRAAYGMRVFKLLWISQFVSGVGTGLGSFSLGVWIYRQNASATQYSMMPFLATCTGLLISPLAGVLADRWDRRRLILLGDSGAALMTCLMALALFTDQLRLWHVYIIIFFMVGFSSLQGPAMVASVSMLVPRRHLARMTGINQAAAFATGLICPPLAGALVPVLGYHGVILIDVTTFLFAFLVLLLIRLPRPAADREHQERRSMLGDFLFGWSYLRQRPGLFNLLTLFATTSFCLAIVQVLLAPLILSFGSATELGVVQAAAASGALLGSLALGLWGGPRNRVLGTLLFMLLQAPILLLGALQPNVALIAAATFVFSGISPFIGGLSQAIWQSKVAHNIQGRVFAIRAVIGGGAAPLAYLMAGPLADRVFEPLMAPGGALAGTIGQIIGVGKGRGVGLLFMTLGLFIILIVLLFSLSPRLRRVESELPDASPPEVAPGGQPTETSLQTA